MLWGRPPITGSAGDHRSLGRGNGVQGQDMVRHMLETHDPRLSRYWSLIAIVKRIPYDQDLDAAWKWILAAAARYLDR